MLPDVDAAVINGNYALQAGFNPVQDSLFLEGSESPYVNVIAVRARDLDNPPDLQKLAEALLSDEVRDFIQAKYGGGVIPPVFLAIRRVPAREPSYFICGVEVWQYPPESAIPPLPIPIQITQQLRQGRVNKAGAAIKMNFTIHPPRTVARA